ncbi:MAG: hypothetical protein JW797_05880 [Bradymonadales bacterium]|nr:hypothetical protein [Bradymonadales bacterium]
MRQNPLKMLQHLAAGLCQDGNFRIVVRRGPWAWSPDDRFLQVDQNDLARLGALACAGLVAHEMGHASISRYHRVTRWALGHFPHPQLGQDALNALEDVRVNAWMARRYPGVKRWFWAVSQDWSEDEPQNLPCCLVFLRRATRDAWIFESEPGEGTVRLDAAGDAGNREGQEQPTASAACGEPSMTTGVLEEGELAEWCKQTAPGSIPPEVAEALHRTAAARRRYAWDFLPPTVPDGSGISVSQDLDIEAEGASLINDRCHDGADSGQECSLTVLAVRAVRHLLQEILPAIRQLWDRDVDRLAAFLGQHPRTRQVAQKLVEKKCLHHLAGLVQSAMAWSPGLPDPPDDDLRALAEQVLVHFLWLGGSPPPSCEDDPASSRRRGVDNRRLARRRAAPAVSELPATTVAADESQQTGSTAPGLREPSRHLEEEWLILSPDRLSSARSTYDEAYREVAGQVETLARRLDELLRARGRLRERSGYSSGGRVDLRAAMAAESDPRQLCAVWKRKTVPDRRRAVFSLLVDLSGSMRGDTIRAATASTALLVETLVRLKIAFEVNGFQDRLVELVGLQEPLDDAARARIGEMPLEVQGCRPGGNNRPGYNDDGPCLLEAGRRLSRHPGQDKVLVVISDGLPEGRHSSSRDLKEAVHRLVQEMRDITLIGLGIGPQTEHVEQFYPHAASNLPVSRFAEVMADLLELAILRRVERLGDRMARAS